MSEPALRQRLPWFFVVLVVAMAAGAGLVHQEVARADQYVVNSTADPGDGTCDATCTLRDALLAASSGAGPHIVTFNLGPGVHVIEPGSGLILQGSAEVIVDGFCGTCDASANTNALWEPINATYSIVISGQNAGAVTGLRVLNPNATIRGLVFQNWQGIAAVSVEGGASVATIAGNFFGTDETGTTAAANVRGISVSGSDGVTIGGPNPADRNLISGNGAGIHLCADGAELVKVWGNYIGTNANGDAALPNGTGINICQGANNDIGGPEGTQRGNLVSGSTNSGILVSNSIEGTIIRGNRVGTTADGNGDVGNNFGISIQSGATTTTIGGAVVEDGNLVSGSVQAGISVSNVNGIVIRNNVIGASASQLTAIPNAGNGMQLTSVANAEIRNNVIAGNADLAGFPQDGLSLGSVTASTVAGNSIGLSAAGAALGNDGAGIRVIGDATGLVIGGTGAGRNFIGSNGGSGVVLNSTSGSPLVIGNRIGVNHAGESRPNGSHGIQVLSGTNVIGTDLPGEGNLIANNPDDGVSVTGATTKTVISSNEIYDNGNAAGDIAIDLGDNGPTPNDPGDGDGSPNSLQNFPVVTGAFSNGISAVVQIALDSTPSIGFTIEVFASSSPSCTAGNNDAEFQVGVQSVLTDAQGLATSTLEISPVPVGYFISATATSDLTGETSELSADCVPVEQAVFVEDPGTGPEFVPNDITIDPGTTLYWLSRDGLSHGVVSKHQENGDAYFDLAFEPDEPAAFLFDAPGEFSYDDFDFQFEGSVTVTGNNPPLNATQLRPDRVFMGSAGFQMEIDATGVNSLTDAELDYGTDADKLFVVQRGVTGMTVEITAAMLEAPGTFEILLTNPAPGGGTVTLPFRVIRPPSDVTCNLVVDGDDVTAVLRQLTGFQDGLLPDDCGIDPITPNADANRDGSATLQDALFIRMRIAELVEDIE